MELIAIWHSINSIPTCLLSTPKTFTFSTIISWFCTVTLLRLCGLRNSSAILATLTNFDWHWHWCALQTFVYNNNLYFQLNPFTTPVQVTDNRGEKYLYNGIADWLYEGMLHIFFYCFYLLFVANFICQSMNTLVFCARLSQVAGSQMSYSKSLGIFRNNHVVDNGTTSTDAMMWRD